MTVNQHQRDGFSKQASIFVFPIFIWIFYFQCAKKTFLLLKLLRLGNAGNALPRNNLRGTQIIYNRPDGRPIPYKLNKSIH